MRPQQRKNSNKFSAWQTRVERVKTSRKFSNSGTPKLVYSLTCLYVVTVLAFAYTHWGGSVSQRRLHVERVTYECARTSAHIQGIPSPTMLQTLYQSNHYDAQTGFIRESTTILPRHDLQTRQHSLCCAKSNFKYKFIYINVCGVLGVAEWRCLCLCAKFSLTLHDFRVSLNCDAYPPHPPPCQS